MSTVNISEDSWRQNVEDAFQAVAAQVQRLADQAGIQVGDVLRQAYELRRREPDVVTDVEYADLNDLWQMRQLVLAMTRPPKGRILAGYDELARRLSKGLSERSVAPH